MRKDNPIIKGKCFICGTMQYLEFKTFLRGETAFVCPKCNASNSKMRLTKEVAEKKAWRIV